MESCKLDDNYLVDLKNGLLFRKGKNYPLCRKTPSTQHCVCRIGGKYRKVHQVIFYQKYGRFPLRPMCIHHINEKKNDNRIENLQEISWGENIAASYNSAVPRLRRQVVVEDSDGNKRMFISMNAAARALGINPCIMSFLISNKTKSTTDQKTGKRCTAYLFIGPLQQTSAG